MIRNHRVFWFFCFFSLSQTVPKVNNYTQVAFQKRVCEFILLVDLGLLIVD